MKRRLLLLIAFFALIAFNVNAQNLNEKEIVGTWKVLNVRMLGNEKIPADKKGELAALKKAFLKSVFHFESDKNFSFDFDHPEMQIKKAHWKYKKSTGSYVIQEWKDKDEERSVLMFIVAKKENGKIIFLLEETPFELEMKKG
jgi:hypothetical protein